MLFLKKKNQRFLNMQGDLVLTHNPVPVRANVGSAVPSIYHGLFVVLPVAGRIRATLAAFKFIWGPSQALQEGPESKTVVKDLTIGVSTTEEG